MSLLRAAKEQGQDIAVMRARDGMMCDRSLIVGTKENAPIIKAFKSTSKCFPGPRKCEGNRPVNEMLDKIYDVIKNSIGATLSV
jgi:hypothetical protein